jgi:hypothetical protein
MVGFTRALKAVRGIRTNNQVATSTTDAPLPTLRGFLESRLSSNERTSRTRNDPRMRVEADLSRNLLTTCLDDDDLGKVLFRHRQDEDTLVRQAALNLWHGWQIAGGRSARQAEASEG